MPRYRIIKRGTEDDPSQFGQPFKLAMPRRADISLWEVEADHELSEAEFGQLAPTRRLGPNRWACAVEGLIWRKIAVSDPNRGGQQ